MGTWVDDLKAKNPALAADYAIAGFQSIANLKRMVRALSVLNYLNTKADEARLAAAKRIIRAAK